MKKKVRGRPKLANPASKMFPLRLRPDQWERWVEAAKKKGKPVAVWLKELADKAS